MRLPYLIAFLAALSGLSACAEKPDSAWAEQRQRMVEEQIQARGVADSAVLAAMRTIERHKFVPPAYRAAAYADHPLPIGEDQTISQPYIVALMTELLRVDSADTVLEIGTGSGYQAAVLAEIVAHVYTIEIVPALARRADSLLASLGYDNITVREGDGYRGWPYHAPFDAVIVTAAPPLIPQPLIDQLAEGGRMVIPVGTDWQELLLLQKEHGEIKSTAVAPVRFVPMTGDGVEKDR